MNVDEASYDPHPDPCLCPECDNDASASSELCGNCEYYGCSDRKAKCG